MKPRSENPKDEGPFAWQTREAAVRAGNGRVSIQNIIK